MQLHTPPRRNPFIRRTPNTDHFLLTSKNYAKYQQGQKLKGARLPALSTASRAAPAAPPAGTRAAAAARVRTVTVSDVRVYPCNRRPCFRFIRLHLVARSRIPVCLRRVGLAPVAVEPSVHRRHLGVGALTRFEPVCCLVLRGKYIYIYSMGGGGVPRAQKADEAWREGGKGGRRGLESGGTVRPKRHANKPGLLK